MSVGSIVSVPLKRKVKEGVVVKAVDKPSFETAPIETLSSKFYTPLQLEIAKFISNYYFSSLGEAISLFLPFREESDARSKERSGKHESICHQEKEAEASPRDIHTHASLQRPALTDAQQVAYHQLLDKERALLFGVTGAGKTEIFIALMAKMLEEGKRTVFLMPEISLTPQMETRLKTYFGERVAMWHSKLSKQQKARILEGIYSGEIRIVAGARSALFVPLRNLGLIIVDEEHDDSYKAMTRPRYHARDVAVLMGQKLGAKVVLASATPSMASYTKYDVIKLEKPFIQAAKHYTFISGDMVNAVILEALKENYRKGGQSLLFLPTRGNFKYLYCEKCGKTHLCPFCSVGMALHRNHRHLKCHYCNYTEAIRESCSYCGHTPLRSERMGTQEASEVIREAIEGIKVEQFDRDSITTANKLKQALQRFEKRESDLLLGTQMLSKGHDYADITLSVIMGLDHILGLADYRARERAMSLFFQIAGRSGRAKAAKVVVQTGDPEFFKRYLGDYESFMKEELAFLEMMEYPPFASLARILIAHKDESKAAKITLDTTAKLKSFEAVEIVGQGKAPVEKIANKYRFHILLRAKSRVPLLKALHAVHSSAIEIDMDPVEFS